MLMCLCKHISSCRLKSNLISLANTLLLSLLVKAVPYFFRHGLGYLWTIHLNSCISVLSVQFCHSVMSNSLQPHGLPTPGACSNSCPSSQWCHPTISSSVIPFSSCLQSFPASESYSKKSALHIRWSKYWSFSLSVSPFNEHSGQISFGILALRALCTVQKGERVWHWKMNSPGL